MLHIFAKKTHKTNLIIKLQVITRLLKRRLGISGMRKKSCFWQLKEGDVIAYSLIDLNSSWTVEFSSFRVGRISYYDAKDIVLILVTKYPIVSDKINENAQNDSLYKEDGTLEVAGGNNEYTDADIDGIREEWSTFVTSFIYP
ncbi:uncharacterized protein LOC143581743 isoform X2 [Bidens hawaiensis]|uniref:uncharacterized protein LOC143581743 isoform X2 n=1 Tax=Bidens hawaiensis TaxID=980011 RepID=UPI00404A8923